MSAIVIEHVKVSELPAEWRARLRASGEAHVIVRIEEEPSESAQAEVEDPNDPLFGMWRDRNDMADVETYVRKLRRSRF